MSNTDIKQYTIRPLLWEELPLTKELRLEIGFVIGTHQLETLWKTDPGSVYGAITDDGELYGVCAIPFVGTDLAQLALLGVVNKCRHQGMGKELLKIALDHVGTHNLYLHCLPAQVPMFKEGNNLQLYTREIKSLGPGVPKLANLVRTLPEIEVVPVSEKLMPLVVRYDERVHGSCRQKLLELALKEPDVETAVACRGSKSVLGYGFMTTSIYGNHVVRGICADSEEIAELILGSLARDAPTLTILVHMRDNEEAYFEKKIGLEVSTTIKTLFRWPSRDADFSKIYAAS
ncbi:uncharacterized protein LOC144169347 [Haemaphysalis longicornis]